jgi:lysophospholipase L1-like esterase
LPRTLHIVGDSTAAEFPATDPRVGWGAVLGAELDGVRVNDAARSGRSSKSYLDEGHFAALEPQLQPGDLVLIEFGHNDEKPDPARATDPATTFRDNLRRYIGACHARGAVPVLLTPICRRRFSGARVTPTHGHFPDATRAVAAETNTPLIDMTARTTELLERFGPDASQQLFAPDDNTHLSPAGALRSCPGADVLSGTIAVSRTERGGGRDLSGRRLHTSFDDERGH